MKKYRLEIKAKGENWIDFPKIKNSADSAKVIKTFYGDDIEIFESFFILLLDRANKPLGYAKISQGGVSGTVVDTMVMAKYAVDAMASGMILAHNHPSGNLKPSQADIRITKKAMSAMKLLNVTVLDHIILTENSHLSMVDEGII